MKNNKKIVMSIFGVMAVLGSCKEPFDANPVPATSSSTFATNFLFVNASADAPSLDFYVNNVKTGASASNDTTSNQAGYTNVKITSNGGFANTNINSRATTGTIGGVLGANNLFFRSANNGTGAFTAADLGNYTGAGVFGGYTVFAVDTINRPAPVRTLNSGNFGDITYYSTKSSFTAPAIVGGGDTTIVLSVSSNNSIATANLLKKYNGNVLPSFFIPIGVVPLGSTDPGGIRFYLTQDIFPIFSSSDLTTKAAFRFINTSPTAAASVTATSYTSTLYARLVGAPNITLSSGATYVMSSANLNPTVGSRTVTASAPNFTLQTLSSPAIYEIQVSTSPTFATIAARRTNFTFLPGKDYTIYTKGLVNGTGEDRLRIGVIQQN